LANERGTNSEIPPSRSKGVDGMGYKDANAQNNKTASHIIRNGTVPPVIGQKDSI
jgi:hypothetical protein